VTEEWRPALAPSVLLRHDDVRDAELLVMPERVVRLTGGAAAIVRLCDGARTTGDIVAELGERFPDAPLATEVPRFLARVRLEGWVR
jgi:pyrroloquinoline quinone biosynthesis protein D